MPTCSSDSRCALTPCFTSASCAARASRVAARDRTSRCRAATRCEGEEAAAAAPGEAEWGLARPPAAMAEVGEPRVWMWALGEEWGAAPGLVGWGSEVVAVASVWAVGSGEARGSTLQGKEV